jgi:polysaccharide export outer membrane protein
MKSLILSACLALSGCGTIYIAPTVSDQATDADVSIVPMNAANVAAANRSTYNPRQLPGVFFQNAGGGGALRAAGALPEPVFDNSPRPTNVPTRLPEPTPETPYQIGVGDVLLLSTQQSARSIEELSGLLAAENSRQGYTVQDDGAIAVPVVGRVRLAGLSLEEAEVEVFQALVENQLDPTFSLEVAEFNSKRVTIGGAVRQPTIVPITLSPITLQEAVAAAGGVETLDTQFTTVRLYRDGTLYQVALDALPSANVRLQAGDSIFIDTDYQLEQAQAYFEEQITLTNLRQAARAQAIAELQTEVALRRASLDEARSAFQARLEADGVDRDYVYLTGEVATIGRFPLPFGRHANLADALFSQGGVLPETGNPAEIYLLRGNARDQVTAYHLDASNPINLIRATDMELRPNDIVFVAQQPVTQWSRVVEQLTTSLIVAGVAQLTN